MNFERVRAVGDRYGEWVMLLPFLFIRLLYADFVPVFDGGLYAGALAEWVDKPSLAGLLDVFGHHPIGYFPPLMLALKILGNTALALNLTQAAIALAVLVTFNRILKFHGGDLYSDVDRAWLTALLSIHPFFLASSINFNLDFGLLFYAILALWCVLEGRFLWSFACGTLLCFTKETGALLWVAAWIPEIAFAWRKGSARTKRGMAAFFSVLAAVGIFQGALRFARGDFLAWSRPGHSLRENFAALLPTNFLDPAFRAYLSMVFVLNFNWILTALGAVFLVSLLHAPTRAKARAHRRVILRFGILLASFLYASTRITPWSNPRYVLGVVPFLLIAASWPLVLCLANEKHRLAAYATVGLALLGADFYSADPLSRSVYGTWRFGGRAMYRTTALHPECCGNHGLDQLVYNLQFAEIHYLANDFLRNALADPRAEIGIPLVLGHGLFAARMDPRTHARTFAPGAPPIPFRFLDAGRIAPTARPLVFPDAPFVDASAEVAGLRRSYADESVVEWSRRGHAFRSRRFTGPR